MPKLPRIYPKDAIGALLKLNFYIHHQVGSHVQLRHLTKENLRVTVPRHDRFELPLYVLNSILKQADITKEEFTRALTK